MDKVFADGLQALIALKTVLTAVPSYGVANSLTVYAVARDEIGLVLSDIREAIEIISTSDSINADQSVYLAQRRDNPYIDAMMRDYASQLGE
jgi:hypothetical protein